MKVRMYNVGFGDCFCLRDRKKSLLVDFGTNNSRIEGRPRREIFDVIISDLSTIKSKNLLLTHFHMDHLSGLLYMMKKKDISVDFGKIYLPDVFSKKEYQALWPDTDAIRKETDEVYNRICEDGKFKEVMDVLLEFAEKLRLIVWSMTAEGNKPAQTVEKETDLTASELTEQPEVRQKIIRAYVYEREFRRIKALPDFKKLLAWLNENQINLRQFKHKISIVFQNARDGELNLLFTGDAQPEHLKMIAENYDGKLPLYEHYWCIKVPHHGTQGHYFDFSQYEPENMLISNGIHFANSKKESKELRTSPLYGGLFYIPDTHMYCSNCDCCDSYENGCSCKEADVISPAYYKDI